MERAFLDLHRDRYGFLMPGRALTLEAVSAEAVGAGARAEPEPALETDAGTAERSAALPAPRESARVFTGGRSHEAPVYVRADLALGAVVDGRPSSASPPARP